MRIMIDTNIFISWGMVVSDISSTSVAADTGRTIPRKQAGPLQQQCFPQKIR